MNKYNELKQRQQQEINALPIRFAFGNKQFKEMMTDWGLDAEKELEQNLSFRKYRGNST